MGNGWPTLGFTQPDPWDPKLWRNAGQQFGWQIGTTPLQSQMNPMTSGLGQFAQMGMRAGLGGGFGFTLPKLSSMFGSGGSNPTPYPSLEGAFV